jgi:hypothetical protein
MNTWHDMSGMSKKRSVSGVERKNVDNELIEIENAKYEMRNNICHNKCFLEHL